MDNQQPRLIFNISKVQRLSLRGVGEKAFVSPKRETHLIEKI